MRVILAPGAWKHTSLTFVGVVGGGVFSQYFLGSGAVRGRWQSALVTEASNRGTLMELDSQHGLVGSRSQDMVRLHIAAYIPSFCRVSSSAGLGAGKGLACEVSQSLPRTGVMRVVVKPVTIPEAWNLAHHHIRYGRLAAEISEQSLNSPKWPL